MTEPGGTVWDRDGKRWTPNDLDRMERALRAVLEICEGLAYENARTTPREYAAQARAEVADTIREAIGGALGNE